MESNMKIAINSLEDARNSLIDAAINLEAIEPKGYFDSTIKNIKEVIGDLSIIGPQRKSRKVT